MKVLFFGLGSIGQRHLRNVTKILDSKVEIHSYRVRGYKYKLNTDSSIDPSGDIERDYKIVTHTNINLAISAKPDIAFITNPSNLHIPIALELAKNGINIFIEKPISSTLDGIDELIEICHQKNITCMIGYNYRFHPGVIYAKDLLDKNMLGNILHVQAEIGEYLPGWHKYQDFREMYASRKDQGGGVILSQIHEMDLLYWFFGMPTSVYALGGSLSNLNLDVEDTSVALMNFAKENKIFPAVLTQDFIQNPSTRTIKIVGDKGSIRLNLISNNLQYFNEKGIEIKHLDFSGFERNDMYVNQMNSFLDSVRNHVPAAITPSIGKKSLEIALGIKTSIQNKSIYYFN